jgi:hypothetical protein
MSPRKMIQALLIFLLLVPVASGTVTFTTPAGSSGSGGPVSATADFDFVNLGITETLTITLTNLLPDPANAGQLLTGLRFMLSSGTASLTSSSGDEVYIDDNGNPSPGIISVDTYWTLDGSGSSTLQLDRHGLPGHGAIHALIGPSGSGGVYHGNASILNSAHIPYLEGPATFCLLVSGFVIDTTVAVTAVRFLFGTEQETQIDVGVIPEPGTALLIGLGLLLIPLARRRGRQ